MIDRQGDRPVLVAGASGFVGSHVTRLLVNNGRNVRVLLRSTSRRDALKYLAVEVVEGDVLDPSSLRTAMRGCASVFYCVVDPRFWLSDQTPIYRNNVEGLANAMDAALASDIDRFIFTSTMGTLGLNPGGKVTEEIPFNWMDRAPPYIKARLEAEALFLAYCENKALPGIALCVANTYGPEDYQPTPHNDLLWKVASGQMKICVDVAQPTVDIRDVALAAVSAETHGGTGERYIIANEYLGAREFYALAVSQSGRSMPTLIPYRVAYGIAWLAEWSARLLRRKDFLLNTDAVYLANIFGEMDSSKARQILEWNPRPLRETVRDAVGWFAEQAALHHA